MMNAFLKAKHWQIFLLTTGVKIIGMIAIMVVFVSMLLQSKEAIAKAFQVLPLGIIMISLISISVQWGWYWSVAIGLQKKVPEVQIQNTSLFKGVVLVFLIGMILFFYVFSSLFEMPFKLQQLNSIGHPPDPPALSFGFPYFLFPLSILIGIGNIYIIYFTAKTIKTVELQRAVKFSDFIAEFFMIWFFPIGIWLIQPKINSWFEE
jgi:hypothetical protein